MKIKYLIVPDSTFLKFFVYVSWEEYFQFLDMVAVISQKKLRLFEIVLLIDIEAVYLEYFFIWSAYS
ncbi:hypothetical protein BC008_01530 [Mastigocoleus testarum BC008]|uniref:Uncharacterized protein n=1 Tax=Mastigocoleus testarum BC008 TaxID=371196 RepID=A0A0V7ZVT5_9CYAN|nr:hypothetical protein BC008_01195 [Mastigocoleus testarum BC008]KST68665.1 hypothetical protein BC008_01530 [Mastigocoleus testarum BC008]